MRNQLPRPGNYTRHPDCGRTTELILRSTAEVPPSTLALLWLLSQRHGLVEQVAPIEGFCRHLEDRDHW